MTAPTDPQTLKLAPGEFIDLGPQTFELEKRLLGDGKAWCLRSIEQRDAPLRWLWLAPRDPQEAATWQAMLEQLLWPTPLRPSLPRLEGLFAIGHRCGALIEPPRENLLSFNDLSWQQAPHEVALLALIELARDLKTIHAAMVSLGGLRREHLRWHESDSRLYLSAMPYARPWRDEVEERWRDLKLVGELLFENLMRRPCPNGHELAAILQSPARMQELGLMQPGLVQLLAGCVTPYGDLAYGSMDELLAALDHLRTELTPTLRFQIASRSTMGTYLFRKNNQDSCAHLTLQSTCSSRQCTSLFACVADGIGGIQDGERASALAVHTACETFVRAWATLGVEQLSKEPVAYARAITKIVSQQLALRGEFDPDHNRGGTTFTAALIVNSRFGLAHVGDSRAYIVRQGRLIQLSTDHNLATILEQLGELEDVGSKSRELAERTISRFLSTAMEVELDRIDSFSAEAARALGLDELDLLRRGLELLPGDRLILTSDGAHGVLTDEMILSSSNEFDDVTHLCDALLALALLHTSKDNVTVLAIDVLA